MKRIRRAWRRLVGALAGSRRERELADEIEMHLQMQEEDNLKLGMSPQEARRAAVLKFGGVESHKERYRDQRGLPAIETFAHDVRFAFRGMRKNPGFTAAAVISLALGIGGATAVFSVADSILLRSLPYSQPERLASISLSSGGAITAVAFDTLSREARSIETAALFVNASFSLAGEGEPERIPGARVSAQLFDVLGIKPQLGRAFAADEDDRADLVVIGDALWKRRFAGDSRVLGRTVRLNGAPHTIIGVMPPGFQFPDGPELPSWAGAFPPAQIWRPMALADWERTCTGCFNFAMIGRLRPGAGSEQARLELNAQLERSKYKSNYGSNAVTVRTLHEAVTGKARKPILIVFAAVALALLIACVNVANLLLARGLKRRSEIALRISLGASGGRVVRQLLTESLALALCAAAISVPIAWAGVRALVAIAPSGIPRIEAAGVDVRMLVFAFAAALASALAFGAAPAILIARSAPGEAIKGGGRSGGGRFSRLRGALVVAEFALSIVLLVASGLLAKSFVTVARTPLGFRAENVLTLRTPLPDKQDDDKRRAAMIEELTVRCRALPGVIDAAAVTTLPLTSASEGWGLIAEDNPNQDDWTMARVRAVTPSYFRTLGIRLLSGREFTSRDDGANPVAIISETAARRFWPGIANPVGRRLKQKRPMTVVGIVEDTRASGLDAEVLPYLYLPFSQFSPDEFALAIRSSSDPASLARAVKAEIWRFDKDQPVTHVAVMKQLVADSIAPRRFQAVLMTVFGAFALALAAVGIYGVLAYSVAQRTREIGIRMALGASRLDVLAGVIKQAGALALVGAAIGLAAASQLTPLLRTLLYGVDASEFSVFAGCALLLVVVALVAGFVPARRAAKLDPTTCLRYE